MARAELTADLAHRLLAHGNALSTRERRDALRFAGPMLRDWSACVRLFTRLYPVGVAVFYGGTLALALGAPLVVGAALQLAGAAAVVLLAGRLHRIADAAVAIAACLARESGR
ncbi:hypothetical protein [Actinokineospora sp.]|uniref:hypothetical protein n=1 Tax=Actinokineospora sp. TaxID=1872133 RepID=UPI00403849C0